MDTIMSLYLHDDVFATICGKLNTEETYIVRSVCVQWATLVDKFLSLINYDDIKRSRIDDYTDWILTHIQLGRTNLVEWHISRYCIPISIYDARRIALSLACVGWIRPIGHIIVNHAPSVRSFEEIMKVAVERGRDDLLRMCMKLSEIPSSKPIDAKDLAEIYHDIESHRDRSELLSDCLEFSIRHNHSRLLKSIISVDSTIRVEVTNEIGGSDSYPISGIVSFERANEEQTEIVDMTRERHNQ